MSSVSLPLAQRVVLLLSGTVKGVALYPESHPAILHPLQELAGVFGTLLADRDEVRFGVVDGVLFFEQHLFFTPSAAVEELTELLVRKGVESVTVAPGLVADELRRFVLLLSRRQLGGGELAQALLRERVVHITLLLVDRDRVREDEEVYDDELKPQATYRQALTVVGGIFRDIESGRIPNSDKLRAVVDQVAVLTIKDPATLIGLAMIKDYDNYTFYHSVNVGVLAMALGSALGIRGEELQELGMAGFLHDVGKTRVEKTILNKPGRLSSDEYEEMMLHSENGARIIGEMEGITPRVAQAVLGHHIRFDRTGYPPWARTLPFDRFCDIIAVADCYDAITTLRVYKSPLNPKEAVELLRGLAGWHLDSALVEKFMEMMGRYPVGTLVRLDTNEIAVVWRPDPHGGERPTVKIVMDGRGKMVDPPLVRDLAREAEGAGIVAVVDPLLKLIDVSKYLE
ncbi:HD domain-containing phosphohydrolase [Geobacter sp.]|uniref:HD-GYP domain-containing protein n=1 Tax=Geobacter sp. TaxID=46610 RepID=UPI002605D670|nr:HD domain-containing phosphohydrolase [Geobacter sp.]